MPSAATHRFTNVGLLPIFSGEAKEEHVAITPSVTLAAGTVLGEIQLSDVWSLATGSQASGNFTLTFGGVTTASIAHNATASAVQTALRAISTIGSAGCTVALASGTPGTDAVYTITFTGSLAYVTNGDLTGTFSSLATPGNASLTHSVTGQPLGTYKAYADANTDGSQVARALLHYAVATDASGNITFGASATGGPYGQTSKSCPVYVRGTFSTADLIGLDAAAVTDLGRLIEGTITAGQLRMP